jgi:hypothetical protein
LKEAFPEMRLQHLSGFKVEAEGLLCEKNSNCAEKNTPFVRRFRTTRGINFLIYKNVANLCIVGEQLIEGVKRAEVEAWPPVTAVPYPDLVMRRKPLLSAETNLLIHAKACNSCNPAVHLYFLP